MNNKGEFINVTPISNNMITTAYIQKLEDKSGIITAVEEKPTFLSIQKVLAVGPRVEDVKVGDWIYLDYARFMKHVKVKSSIRAGIGGEDMIKEEFVPPGWLAPGDDKGSYFKITDREIEGVIKDYDKLPEEMKKMQTITEFEESQEKKRKENLEAMEKAKKETSKGVVDLNRKGPAIITDKSAGGSRF